MNRTIQTAWLLAALLLLTACSTKKNTWLTRNFHALTTRYNIAFNGNESYEEGLRNMLEGNVDDYSTVIPLYPISHHDNASAATSNMDRAIEKGRKAIKLHSIKAKPKRDSKKWSDPAYRAFYEQSEFNPALKDAWMLVARSEFHKADFLGSIGTFTYISRFYATDKDLVAQCQLWMVRAYAEMDWIYEAEQMLGKVNQDDLRSANVGLFASANAVLLLKQDRYREALPFVEMLVSRERNKAMKQRFTFVQAQLQQLTGDRQAAIDSYTAVLKMNPPYVMDFNARINRAQLMAGTSMDKVLKELNKMARNSNNKDYLDQIYYAIGNAYLNNGDTARAVENYRLAAEKSTRNGVEKAVTLIKMGDLFYGRRDYVEAQPAYAEASGIITPEHDDYARVSRLSEVLGELVVPYETVVLQDSLQHLATLSEEEQLEVIKKVIEYKIEQERLAQEKAEEQARLAEEEANKFVPIGGPAGADAGKWYFYNANLVRTGKAEFQKRWGNRKLEDNWRRMNKSAALFADDGFGDGMGDGLPTDSLSGDSVQNALPDDKNPEYYLKQIPSTPEQIALSNQQIADALLSMGAIYKDKLNDLPLAVEAYEEFIRRFGTDARVPDAYFQLYLIETKREDQAAADLYRDKIVRDYPDTKYAQILAHPDYIARFNQMQQEQDSLYAATYAAYSANRFQEVVDNVYHARVNYPLSDLMPKFLFLEALTIGKTDTPEHFEQALNDLVAAYPQSDVSAMAKDIAAMIRQGREAQTGTSHGTLLTRRGDELKAAMEVVDSVAAGQAYSPDKQGKHRVMFISAAEQQAMYALMYQVAAYNFTRFMIKEFDLVLNPLDDTRQVLSVTNFESYDEAQWYISSVNKDLTLGDLFRQMGMQEVVISEENFALLRLLGLDAYLLFQAQQLGDRSVSIEAAPAPQAEPTAPAAELQPAPSTAVEEVPVTVLPDEELPAPPAEAPQPAEAAADTLPIPETQQAGEASQPVEVPQPESASAEPVHPVVQELAEEEGLDLYEGLFAYQPDKPHFVALYVLSGTPDFDRFKADMDAYNAQNYAMLNLDVAMETVGGRQVIIIGSFGDANVAKSYLLRMVKEKNLFEGLKGSNYRNLFGTQRNLNVLMQNDALSIYTKFMQEYYLK